MHLRGRWKRGNGRFRSAIPTVRLTLTITNPNPNPILNPNSNPNPPQCPTVGMADPGSGEPVPMENRVPWKVRGVENAGLENAGPNFQG